MQIIGLKWASIITADGTVLKTKAAASLLELEVWREPLEIFFGKVGTVAQVRPRVQRTEFLAEAHDGAHLFVGEIGMPQQGFEVGLVHIDLPRLFIRANLEPLLYALGQIVDFAQLRRADVAAQPLAVAANLRRAVTPYAGYALKERRVGSV